MKAISALILALLLGALGILLYMASIAAFYALAVQSGRAFVSLLVLMALVFAVATAWRRLAMPFARRCWDAGS